MGLTSLQACMDSDWLQEAESAGGSMLDSSTTSPSAAAIDVVAAALMDGGGRRLRPPHDHPQKCPRCDSTHTKFCYYNNYSLSQPRYFCKTCRRYWTNGGTIRNIPVGGGCRKNKKPSSGKKLPNIVALPHSHQNYENASLGFSNFSGIGSYTAPEYSKVGFLDSKNGFLENKFDLMGVNKDNVVMVNHHHHMGLNHGFGLNDNNNGGFHEISPGSNGGSEFMDISTYQRLMLSNYNEDHQRLTTLMDVKPNQKLLSLDWHQDQGYSDGGASGGGGYINGISSPWNGLMNGFGNGTSTKTNSFV